jgi:hypothetical protein
MAGAGKRRTVESGGEVLLNQRRDDDDAHVSGLAGRNGVEDRAVVRPKPRVRCMSTLLSHVKVDNARLIERVDRRPGRRPVRSVPRRM